MQTQGQQKSEEFELQDSSSYFWFLAGSATGDEAMDKARRRASEKQRKDVEVEGIWGEGLLSGARS
jgi:hypothetical protein